MSSASGATGKWISIREICAEFGIQDTTVRKWIRDGKLKAVGKRRGATRPHLLFDRKEVLAVWTHKREVEGNFKDRERERQHRAMLEELDEETERETKRFAEWQKEFLKKLERK